MAVGRHTGCAHYLQTAEGDRTRRMAKPWLRFTGEHCGRLTLRTAARIIRFRHRRQVSSNVALPPALSQAAFGDGRVETHRWWEACFLTVRKPHGGVARQVRTDRLVPYTNSPLRAIVRSFCRRGKGKFSGHHIIKAFTTQSFGPRSRISGLQHSSFFILHKNVGVTRGRPQPRGWPPGIFSVGPLARRAFFCWSPRPPGEGRVRALCGKDLRGSLMASLPRLSIPASVATGPRNVAARKLSESLANNSLRVNKKVAFGRLSSQHRWLAQRGMLQCRQISEDA